MPLGVLILLFRRLPVVFAMHKQIRQIEGMRHALFVGFFGPIGVSAIFYLYVSIDFLNTIVDANGEVRSDAQRLGEVMLVVIWFTATCSNVVHGLSIPLGKLGYHLPRTISSAYISRDRDTTDPFQIVGSNQLPPDQRLGLRNRQQEETTPSSNDTRPTPQPIVFKIGGSTIPPRDVTASPDLSIRPEIRESLATSTTASGRQLAEDA